mmetsp:Transcript_7625/g.25250  ORF Transcript_7625/g.25250 Transcript_7625/m.25250 type:complete len:202 (+) Transcript_7625:465-1070(+)
MEDCGGCDESLSQLEITPRLQSRGSPARTGRRCGGDSARTRNGCAAREKSHAWRRRHRPRVEAVRPSSRAGRSGALPRTGMALKTDSRRFRRTGTCRRRSLLLWCSPARACAFAARARSRAQSRASPALLELFLLLSRRRCPNLFRWWKEDIHRRSGPRPQAVGTRVDWRCERNSPLDTRLSPLRVCPVPAPLHLRRRPQK